MTAQLRRDDVEDCARPARRAPSGHRSLIAAIVAIYYSRYRVEDESRGDWDLGIKARAAVLALLLTVAPVVSAAAQNHDVPGRSSLDIDARLRAVEARLTRLEEASVSRPAATSPSSTGRRITFNAGSSFAIYPRGCGHHLRDVVCEFRIERLSGGQDKTFLIIANVLAGVTTIVGADGNQFPASNVGIAHETDMLGGGSRQVDLEVGEQASFEMTFRNAVVPAGSAKIILKVAGQLDSQHRVVTTVPVDVTVAP